MSVFAKLPNIFKRFQIGNEKLLKDFLAKYPNSGWERSKYWDGHLAGAEQNILANNIFADLLDITKQLPSLYESFGIQQFIISKAPRISEEVVKKALFISRTCTVFTPAHFNREVESYLDDYLHEYLTYVWDYDYNFIGDLFRFQEAIQHGDLIILPSSISSSFSRKYAWDRYDVEPEKENFPSVKELIHTRVLNLDQSTASLDTVMAAYKTGNQLISLPDIDMPWIKDVDVPTILKVKDECHDLLDNFQRAYHESLLVHIENHKSLDFGKISKQINQDLLVPKVNAIQRKYKRILSLHRSLTMAGAIISLIPISGVVLSGALQNNTQLSAIASAFPSTLASLVATTLTNRVHKSHAIRALEDDAFFILWKLKREKPSRNR